MKPRTDRVAMRWLALLAAPLIWFAHFSALYAVASFGKPSGVRFDHLAWAMTGIACLALAGAWYWLRRSAKEHTSPEGPAEMADWLALLSLAGILFQGVVLALVP